MRLIQYCIEHRRKVAGRSIDDPEHLGGRGLLLQGFARLGQEPRILHCDDRLSSEILQQRDLFVRKRANFLAIDGHRAQYGIIFAQRDGKHASTAADIGKSGSGGARSVTFALSNIGHVKNAFAFENSGQKAVTLRARADRPALREPLCEPRVAMRSQGVEDFAVTTPEMPVNSLAEPNRFLQYRIEYRRQIARREVDDLQDLGHRRLAGELVVAFGFPLVQLPQRFVPLGSALRELALKLSNDLLRIG